MSDTFSHSCGPSTSDGYIRGTDETLTETEGAGAASAARREVARGRGKPGRGRATGRRVAPDRNALGSCTTRGRRGSIAPGAAFWASGAAQRDTTPGVGAASQRWSTCGGFSHRVMDVAADRATDRGEVRRENGPLLGLAIARTAWLGRAAADWPGAGTRQGRVIVFI